MNRSAVLGRGSFCLVTALALVFACGDDSRPPPLQPSGGSSGGGVGGTNPFGGAGGSGGTGADAEPQDPLAPQVTILTPEAVSEPNTGVVLTPEDAEAVKVVCKASQSERTGAKPVRASSVKIRVLDAKDMEVASATGAPNGNADEFEAEFVLGMVATGRVTFLCSAEDQSTPPKKGEDANSTFLDHGPKIEILTPARDSALPLKGTSPFSFKVTPASLADGDVGAAVSRVSLHVRQLEIKNLVEEPAGSGVYIADVNFEDAMFSPSPRGEIQVNISATNSRSPEAAREDVGYGVDIDADGPIIEITSHKNQDVVTGRVKLTFRVIDPLSGVDPSTVVVKLNDLDDIGYNDMNGLWLRNGENFTYEFDSKSVGGSLVQIHVVVRAKDGVGNPSLDDAATRDLYRDDRGPSVDLDPRRVRERKVVNNIPYCSNSFDPLGDDAPNDEGSVWGAPRFRVLFWDETNELPGVTRYYFQMDPTTLPRLFIQPDANKPLLTDTNNDGQCDTIDNSVAAGVGESDLLPVTVQGSSWWANETNLQPPMQECTPQNLSAPAPARLCGSSSGSTATTTLTRAIRHGAKHPNGQVAPVVYAPSVTGGLDCTGGAVPLANFGVVEGRWVCIVARGLDRGKNVGFSRPLRVCPDDPSNGPNPCPQPPPTCTKDCNSPQQVTLGDGTGIIAE
jgi:hypothetical protein